MPTIVIRRIAFSDIEHAPNIAELLAEYGAESAIHEIGEPIMQVDLYRKMELTGALHILGAFQGETLVGFLLLITTVVPHFGKCIATTESFFVAMSARKSGAGLKLLHEAEHLAREVGAVGLFVSAPVNGVLAKVMPNCGYRHTNQVFFRGLQ